MQISLMDAKSIARCLSALIRKHDRISIAVAWGGIMPVAETLLANRARFEFVSSTLRTPSLRRTARAASTPRSSTSSPAPRPRRSSAARISPRVASARTWRQVSTSKAPLTIPSSSKSGTNSIATSPCASRSPSHWLTAIAANLRPPAARRGPEIRCCRVEARTGHASIRRSASCRGRSLPNSPGRTCITTSKSV